MALHSMGIEWLMSIGMRNVTESGKNNDTINVIDSGTDNLEVSVKDLRIAYDTHNVTIEQITIIVDIFEYWMYMELEKSARDESRKKRRGRR